MAGRAAEATDAVTQHLASGATVRLLSFTASHTREDALSDLLDKHADAHRRFWSQRSVKQALKRSGSVGRITGQECTYGTRSGWHPHRHVLCFVDSISESDEALLKREWVASCKQAGLSCTYERGLDVRGGDNRVGQYLAKLGLEVTLVNAKKGRAGGMAPFQLLDWAEDLPLARDLYQEFACAMKGKRALWWSRGLKKRFGIDEVSDEELVEAPAEEDEILRALLHRDGLRLLSRHAAQGEFLALCGADDFDEARRFLVEKGGHPTWLDANM
jgi:hypothetical protein